MGDVVSGQQLRLGGGWGGNPRRGLDMPGRVDHVVNFDFPMNPIDYIHRTGRTARAGSSGRITSIVAKRDATLAGRIEQVGGHAGHVCACAVCCSFWGPQGSRPHGCWGVGRSCGTWVPRRT